jgi:hypothetical protein
MKSSKNLLKGIFIGMGVMALTAFAAEKTFTLKFSETEINKHYQKLSVIRQIVDNSNLSHQEVVYVTKAIDSLQAEIVAQVKTQIEQPAPPPANGKKQ